MYIEYISGQRPTDPALIQSCRDAKGGSGFKPTWLIETHCWTIVNGNQAANGYCALSYCWKQSGDLIRGFSGDFECNDNRCHRLTFEDHGGNKLTAPVSFEDILIQICRDYKIDYLWYDKLCIDQTNKQEKLREIKQMHRIYNNARFTVALVPEVQASNSMNGNYHDTFQRTDVEKEALCTLMLKSHWWTRSWTLEELMMSRQMLVVGTNTEIWYQADDIQDNPLEMFGNIISPMLGYKTTKWRSANQVLSHAHFRTSSKAHDKIFALANIFDDLISIDIDYDKNILTVVDTFYRSLAEWDLSVMCFGSVQGMANMQSIYTETTMDFYNLPSWTGVSGIHVGIPIRDITLYPTDSQLIDSEMNLHLVSKYYTIRPTKFDNDTILNGVNRYYQTIGYDQYQAAALNERYHQWLQASETSIQEFTLSAFDLNGREKLARDIAQLVMQCYGDCYPTHYYGETAACLSSRSPILPLSLTEDCDECIVISVLFDCVRRWVTENDNGDGYQISFSHAYLLPVLKMNADNQRYRVIGTILVRLYQGGETPEEHNTVLNEIFTDRCAEPKHFTIK